MCHGTIFFGLETNEKQKVEREIWLLNQLDALEDKWDSHKSIKYKHSYALTGYTIERSP